MDPELTRTWSKAPNEAVHWMAAASGIGWGSPQGARPRQRKSWYSERGMPSRWRGLVVRGELAQWTGHRRGHGSGDRSRSPGEQAAVTCGFGRVEGGARRQQ